MAADQKQIKVSLLRRDHFFEIFSKTFVERMHFSYAIIIRYSFNAGSMAAIGNTA